MIQIKHYKTKELFIYFYNSIVEEREIWTLDITIKNTRKGAY